MPLSELNPLSCQARGQICARLTILVFALAVVGSGEANAEGTPGEGSAGAANPKNIGAEAKPEPKAEVALKVVYRPPRRGAPRELVGGGVRGGGLALPDALALVPSHVGLTSRGAPSLFWRVDGPVGNARVVFTLTRDDLIEPVVEEELARPQSAGIQRVRLSDYGVELEEEVEHQWFVSIVPQGENPRGKKLATGYIQRVAGRAVAPGADATTYAEQGLWYDALESLSDAVDESPADAAAVARRTALLRQDSGLAARLP